MNISTVPLKIALISFGTCAALALTATVPTQAAHALTSEVFEPSTPVVTQKLVTAEYAETSLTSLETPTVEISEEWLKAQEEARLEAERKKAEKEEEERLAALNNASPSVDSHVYRDVPAGEGAQGLVDAAKAQVGVVQDCTDLVQNSLAAIGKTERRDRGGFDLGTGIWQYDHFGTRVDINSLAPGDILIYGNAGSGAHVSIYIGNGQAVHGGYNGTTTIAGANQAWQPLTGAIRL